MRFCPNCGQQLSEGVNFCNNCGASINGNQPQGGFNSNASVNAPKVEERNIVTCILLSIITCGIYGIIWMINMANDVNAVSDEKGPSGGMVVLFTIITCGIYGIYWVYKAGQNMYAAGKKYGKDTADNAVLYLVLAIIGLQIVDYCLIQSELNRYAQKN